MFATPEQLAAAQKAGFESFYTFSSKAFEGLEKLVELNVNVAKATLEESADKVKELLSVKDVQELLSFNSTLAQPAAEKALAYSRHVYDIASTTQSDLQKLAEVQIAEGNKKVAALVDNMTKNAPAGSETAVSIFKSAVGAANSAYESINKVAKQFVEVTEANVTAATNATVKAASAASTGRSKK